MEARGIPAEALIKGVKRSTLDELTEWTTAAGKVIGF
jgi:sulfur relay (sulfurtransferase) complex TusBCD TusD component (DsrE family)